jgi:hypothetical protein
LFKQFVFAALCVMAVQTYGFEPFAGAVLQSEQRQTMTDHWVVLGAVERMKGVVIAEKDVRLNGEVESQVWQAPAGHNIDEVHDFYRRQAQKNGLDRIFDCRGRACGTSNDYANQVFGKSLLTARDADQRYWVGIKWDGKEGQLWLIYTVQKVSKGTLVYFEKITLPESSKTKFSDVLAGSRVSGLLDKGYLVLEQFTDSPQLTGQDREWLLLLMQEYPQKHFALVVHQYAGKRLSAEQLSPLLQVPVGLEVFYAGAFAPREGFANRIEVVVLP